MSPAGDGADILGPQSAQSSIAWIARSLRLPALASCFDSWEHLHKHLKE